MKAYRFLDCSLIRLDDENAYRFLSVCCSLGVEIYDIDLHMSDSSNNEYCFYVKNVHMEKLNEASVKTGINYEVIKRSGIISSLKKNFKRKILITSIITAAALLYIMTLFIWQIQITGCVSNDEAKLLAFINESGIHYGMLKGKCDCESIEEVIRNNFENILWVSVAIDGTGLFIQIKENTYLNDKLAITDDVADLVSDTDAKIVSIVTREGVPIVSAGDEIQKGDILISGVKEYLNDANEVYKTEHVFADGDIIAECVKTYEWKYPRTVNVRKYKKNRIGFQFNFCNKKLFGYEPDIGNEVFEKNTNEKVLVLGNDFYLPISIKYERYRLYSLEEIDLSDEALTRLANIYYKMFCVKESLKGVDIIEKNATINLGEKYCTVKACFVTHENIGVHTAITEEPIEEKLMEDFNN